MDWLLLLLRLSPYDSAPMKAFGLACQAWENRLWADLASNTQVAVYTVIQLQGAPGFVMPFILTGIKKL